MGVVESWSLSRYRGVVESWSHLTACRGRVVHVGIREAFLVDLTLNLTAFVELTGSRKHNLKHQLMLIEHRSIN